MRLVYLHSQDLVFFKSNAKFVIVTKGRRVGLTRGAAQAFIEKGLQSTQRILWGETIYSNVQRYIDLYFMPILKQLPKHVGWEWKAKLMQLQIQGTIIDFRSADSPETWEGFGYNIIFLNEAGIILKDPNLLKKTVLPMLMDYANSQLIAAGVPKGKKLKNGDPHPFYQLWERAEHDHNYARYKFSSYTNSFLRPQDIKEIEDVLDSSMQLQEIHGEFIDVTDRPFLYEFDPQRHIINSYEPKLNLPIWLSVDFNISPNSCLIGQEPDQYGVVMFDEISIEGSTDQVCEVVMARYSHWVKRGMVFVAGDATGNNRNAMSGELTNYIIIKKSLSIRDSQMRVKRVNNPLDSSRTICNAILNKLEVRITKNCKQTIIDCQLAEVDAGGNLIKVNGLHKFDCFRYLVEARYPEFLKHIERYLRPSPRQQSVQRQRISINQKNETQLQPILKQT